LFTHLDSATVIVCAEPALLNRTKKEVSKIKIFIQLP